MERDEAGALARLRTCRRELIDPTVRAHSGRIVKGTGDGVLAEFASVVDAVQAAIHIQAGAAADPAGAIVFRIGVNVGDVVVENGDIFGDGVNVAARLESLAEPGGICISGAALDQIRGKVLHEFKPLGSHQLKNIARPVEVFGLTRDMIVALGPAGVRTGADPLLVRRGRRVAVGAALAAALAVAGLAAVSLRAPATGPGPTVEASGESVSRAPAPVAQAPAVQAPSAQGPGVQVAGGPESAQAVMGGTGASKSPAEQRPSSPPPLSIVVLPFSNFSGDPAQDYFVDGLTEDLTTDLSRIDGSLVIARNTAFTYKGKAVDVKAVGRELGVRYVLEGSVRRTGDTVRINVQLIDSETGLHVWAERFDHDVGDLLELGDRIASRIARSLDLQLVEAESRRGAARANPDATDLAMRGWALINRARSRENTMGAADLFQQALAIDPDNVRAGLGLARASYFMTTQRLVDQPTLLLERAETLARRAVALAPSSGLAHNVLSDVLTGKKQLDDALVAMRKAVEINRNDAGAWGSIGYLTAMTGRFEKRRSPFSERWRSARATRPCGCGGCGWACAISSWARTMPRCAGSGWRRSRTPTPTCSSSITAASPAASAARMRPGRRSPRSCDCGRRRPSPASAGKPRPTTLATSRSGRGSSTAWPRAACLSNQRAAAYRPSSARPG
jgi:TolB-like protein